MKVLHILDSLSRAGAEMLVLDICRNAAVNGLDIAFAALGGGSLEKDFKESGVEYIRLHRRLPVDPRVIKGLRRFIRNNKIELVHAHQAVDGLHAYLAAIGTPVKLVLTYHGHFSDQKNRLVLKFLAPRVSANVSCSRGLVSWLAEQGICIDDFRVIYNGVDRKRLEYVGPSLRDELHIPSEATIFGMVAHFHPAPRKDQMTLCRAFVKAGRQLTNAHLVIVGKPIGAEGVAKMELCKEICRQGGVADRVHFLGEQDSVAQIVSGLDVCVLSSLHEGLPIALIEAMLTKTPLIVSDIQPHLEASDSGKYAVTFKTQDDEDLSAKMLELAGDGHRRTELAIAAFEYALQKFSIERHIANLKKLYTEVTSSPQS